MVSPGRYLRDLDVLNPHAAPDLDQVRLAMKRVQQVGEHVLAFVRRFGDKVDLEHSLIVGARFRNDFDVVDAV